MIPIASQAIIRRTIDLDAFRTRLSPDPVIANRGLHRRLQSSSDAICCPGRASLSSVAVLRVPECRRSGEEAADS